jgi:tetratricopeptide (TPR) repeat protein
MTLYPKSTLFVLLPFLFSTVCAMLFSACLTLDPDDTPIIDAETRIKRSSTVIGDTFNVVYLPPEPIDSNQSPPTVVYTFKFWQPEFFESESPQIRRAKMENYRNLYWYLPIAIPSSAQILSYYIADIPNQDSLATEDYLIYNRAGKPVQWSHYRLAHALLRRKANIDTVLSLLKTELSLYPNSDDAYISYWSLYFQHAGRTDEALATIEREIAEVRRQRRDDPRLLEAISLMYIYGMNNRRRAYEITRDIPDTYLHPLNLYNRFLIEPDNDKRELALAAMTEKYPTHPLTPKMNLTHLLFYLSNQTFSSYRDRGAIFAESILNRRLTALRNARVNTYAIRYLFDYYASLNPSKALPYVRDVLRMDYDREVYDPLTLLGFAARYADTKDYAGLAIDLASKAIEAIETDKQKPLVFRPEPEFVQTEAVRRLFHQDVIGCAYYYIGKAYLSIGDDKSALANFREAEKTCLSQQAELYFEMAKLLHKLKDGAALDYAIKSLAVKNSDAVQAWLNTSLKPKFKKGESVSSLLSTALRSAPPFSLTLLNGKTVSSESLANPLTLLYFWSPNSTMSKLLLSELQLLSAKYRARGVGFFAIDTEDDLRTVKSSPEEFAFSIPFATATPEMIVDYQVSLLPSVVIIKSGKIIYRQLGYCKDFVSQVEVALQDALLTSDASTALPNEKKRKR